MTKVSSSLLIAKIRPLSIAPRSSRGSVRRDRRGRARHQRQSDERVGLRVFGTTFVVFGIVALVLATVGLYAGL
jgi:hypothetical protein